MADPSTQPLTQQSFVENQILDDQQSVYGILVPGNAERDPVSLRTTQKVYTFGRLQTSDIVLPASDKISVLHFKIILVEHGHDPESTVIVLEDCSTNGTFINGKKIGKHKRKLLQHGDVISLCVARNKPDISYVYRHAVRFTQSQEEELDGIHAKYDFGSALGKGAFATVKQVVDKSSGIVRACKVMEKQRLALAMKPHMVQREVEILRQLQHTHIVGYVDYFEDEETIFIVMELARGGDMLQYINKHHGLREPEAKRLMRQVFEAIKYTHSLKITHRDLKPDNILLTGDDPPNAKVTDFGLAKAVDQMTFLKTLCGTPTFLAPEIINPGNKKQGYSEAVDAWSLGVIVYTALANEYPFADGDSQSLFQKIVSRTLSWNPLLQRHISQEAIDFIDRLLTLDPIGRMTVAEALDHPWLAQNTQDGSVSPTDHESSLTRENTGTTSIELDVLDPSVPTSGQSDLFMEMDDPFAPPARKRPRSQNLSNAELSLMGPLTTENLNGTMKPSSLLINGTPMDLDGSILNRPGPSPHSPLKMDSPLSFWAALLSKPGSSLHINFGILQEPSQLCPLTIGRADENLIILEDNLISKFHCLLYVTDGHTCIKDLSRNGVLINDTILGNGKIRKLEDCDEITLTQDLEPGRNITFVFRPWKDVPTIEQQLPFKCINIPIDNRSKRRKFDLSWARLRSINPSFPDIMLRETYVKLGRGSECHHTLKEARVSVEHCILKLEESDKVYITDLNSYNGTYLNGKRLTPGKRQRIKNDDQIVLVYADASDSSQVHKQIIKDGALDINNDGVIIGFVFNLL